MKTKPYNIFFFFLHGFKNTLRWHMHLVIFCINIDSKWVLMVNKQVTVVFMTYLLDLDSK